MSTFDVEKRKVEKIWEHSNADRLEVGKVYGLEYQFCVTKGMYQPGDDVVYFPIDSLLPNSLSAYLGIQNLLTGKDKNRLKTVTLRGEISQGFIVHEEKIKEFLNVTELPDNLTEVLEVKKFEPEEILTKSGNLVALPSFVSFYDIENVDRFNDVVDSLMDEKVVITEKVEGTHFAISIDESGEVLVCQRRDAIKEIEGKEHVFCRTARNLGLVEAITKMRDDKFFDNKPIVLRGELIGPKIQRNYYKIKKFQIKLFDIMVGYKYIDWKDFTNVTIRYGLSDMVVPVLSQGVTLRDALKGKSVKDYSNGKSILNNSVLREGIVIKPETERYIQQYGRCIIKQRDPFYLSKSDA